MEFRRFTRKAIYIPKERKPSTLERFREELVKINEKSQDSFETQLSYIAAGSIGISVVFISDIIPTPQAKYVAFLLIGWLLLTACLFINLYSHIVSFKNHRKTIIDIDTNNYDPQTANRRNKIINRWNVGSHWTLITGILSILLFITINMLLMAKEVKVVPQNPATERKGRESVTQPPSIKTNPDTVKPKTGRETPSQPPNVKR